MEKSKAYLHSILENRIVDKVLSVLYPLVLVIYSLCRVNKGLDITDTAYNYSNFRFLSGLDDMWFFSTFLTNVTGKFFTLLPGGRTMLGLNIYTGLIKTAILLIAFFFLTRRVKLSKHLVFIGELAAAGLSWCPTAVLYNYLTYLLLLLGVIFIYEAETSDNVKRENIFFILAGLMLGMNVFVRLPNLCEAALIVTVWYMAFIKKESFSNALRQTLVCIGGYLGAFLLCVLAACASRGFSAYVRGITQMLSGGGDAKSQYTPMGLIFTAFSGYIGIKYWAVIGLAGLILVAVFSLIMTKVSKKWVQKENLVKLISFANYFVAIVVFALVIFKFKRTDLYTNNYYEYSSMYGINVIVLLISIACALLVALNKKEEKELRFIAASCLVIILVTPLGSNNGMYSVLNNQYLMLPFMLTYIARESAGLDWVKPVKVHLALIITVAMIHSLLFGLNFSFRDGGGQRMTGRVENNEILKGMETIPRNAKFLSEISDIWDKGYKDSTILVFGNAAGLSFYLDAKPAISTVWPSLASFSLEKFENEMRLLRKNHYENGVMLPVIFLGNDGIDAYRAMQASDTAAIEEFLGETYIKKIEILYDFLNNYEYSEIYCCDTFWVLAPKEK